MRHADPGRILVAQRRQIAIAIQHMAHARHAGATPDVVQQAQDVGSLRIQRGEMRRDELRRFGDMARMLDPGAGVERAGLPQHCLSLGAIGDSH